MRRAPVVVAVFNSLAGSGVLPGAGVSCTPPPPVPTRPTPPGLGWIYTISGCSGTTAADNLIITINRGWLCPAPCASGPPVAVGTMVTVTYPYHWRFNSVIQLLFPGAKYLPLTYLTESATVHNQM